MDRNEDINLDEQLVPTDCYLHEGSHLMIWARLAKIPYGIGYRKVPCGSKGGHTKATIGLIIRETDRVAFDRVLARPRKARR